MDQFNKTSIVLRQGRRASMILAVVGSTCGWSSPQALAEQAAERLVPVHAMVPSKAGSAPEVALTGTVAARTQTNLAFRVDGKVTARPVETGQHVGGDTVLAVLDPTEQKADVDNAQAALNSAEALLQQATTTFGRQKTLVETGFTTRASFDSATAALKTSQSEVEVAKAALDKAKEQLSYTELRAGHDGIVISRSVEVGQVVQAGQTIYVLAEDGLRDAVFDIYERLLIKAPSSRTIDVVLQSDPTVHVTGQVREIAPVIDPSSSTVKVKVGLDTTPPQMTLGAAVVGQGRWDKRGAIVLPWSALFEWEGRPAVWVVDDAGIVSVKLVEVGSYATGSVTLSGGLDGQERVVTAGTQFLYPGQKVQVVEGGQL